MRFCHLHTHSHYSLLQAVPKIQSLVQAAKEAGHTHLALTDMGNLYGAIEFYKECRAAGIVPIIGVDMPVAPRTRHNTEHGIDDVIDRIVLLARDMKGYKNLLTLVSRAQTEGFMHTPRADDALLEEYKEGLVALIPTYTHSFDGELEEPKRTYITRMQRIYTDTLYIEYAYHKKTYGNKERLASLRVLSKETGVPLVASREVYYLEDKDNVTKALVAHIAHNTHMGQEDEDRSEDFSFWTEDTVATEAAFAPATDALTNLAKIQQMCALELELGHWVFPNFPLNSGSTYDDMLRRDTYRAAEERGMNLGDTKNTSGTSLKERIDYELAVISKKGYAPYFLVVADLMYHARESGIYTNTRGSAAGSLVSFINGITTVDPIELGLPFERFLNPERPSPPDIDMDVADNKRDELIAYARTKYGADHVAQIGTFGTMAARAAVRDVARALGHSYSVGDRIAKLIPIGAQGFLVTIQKALDTEKELAALYKKDPIVRQVLTYAERIEGNARHMGVHAAGVVMSPTPVTNFTPVQLDPKTHGENAANRKIITQYDMYSVEEAGLLKFDFLGLKNLAVLADAVARVKKIQNIDVPIYDLPMRDEKTFAMLAAGRTMGVFQFASGGMTRYLVDLVPSSVYDLNAMVALYRPGPMESIPEYIARKHNPSSVTYLDPRLIPILEKSYGIITYQDDVLMIAIHIAGYTWLEADKFRKAMGKKIPEEMAAQKERFFTGCRASNTKERVIEDLWKQIETFAAYGFNKAHAASYGNLAYKTAYMKANYPSEYMAALMTADAGDVESIAEMVKECGKMSITVLPPHINESLGVFSVDTLTHEAQRRSIRFGLTSIKNFGEGLAEVIVDERKKGGAYTSLVDFLSRVGDRNLNKKSLEALIKSGSLDTFASRGALLHNLETILAFHKEVHKEKTQDSLFDASDFGSSTLTLAEPKTKLSAKDMLRDEKELLGLYISGHPLDAHKDVLAGKPTLHDMLTNMPLGTTNVVGVHIDDVRTLLTKKGDKMAFVKMHDFSTESEAVFFPEVYMKHRDLLAAGNTVLIKGKVTNRNGEKSVLADAVRIL